MARYVTRGKLCETIKISDSSLRKFISRGRIKEDKKDNIDLDDEDNKQYIINYASKKGVDAEDIFYSSKSKQKREPKKVITEEIPEDEPEPDKPKKGRLPLAELQRVKTEKEIEKLEADTRLKNLELQKKKAKVLPLDFVIEWSSLNIRGVFGETINFGNSIIEQMCNELDADTETKLKFKKKFKQGFNEVLKTGIKKQKPEAIEQAKEYSLLTKW